MKFIRVFEHENTTYIEPYDIVLSEVPDVIRHHGQSVIADIKSREHNETHVIYATKVYNKEDRLSEIHLYNVQLDDDEFEKRTRNLLTTLRSISKDAAIYAFHKGTNY